MEVSFLKSAFNEGHYPLPDRPEIAFAGRSNVGRPDPESRKSLKPLDPPVKPGDDGITTFLTFC